MSTGVPRVNLFRNSEAEAAAAGTIIFTAGETGDCMFAVRSGEVELVVGDHVVEVVEEGGVFGEMALIDGSPRTATARIKTAAELVRIDAPRFDFMVRQTPNFAMHVMRVLAERLRRTTHLTHA